MSSEPGATNGDLEATREVTELMRSSEAEHWKQFRRLLADEGLKPAEVALADFMPDGGLLYSAVMVARDDRVFEVTLQLPAPGADDGYVHSLEQLYEVRGVYEHGASLARHVLGEGGSSES